MNVIGALCSEKYLNCFCRRRDLFAQSLLQAAKLPAHLDYLYLNSKVCTCRPAAVRDSGTVGCRQSLVHLASLSVLGTIVCLLTARSLFFSKVLLNGHMQSLGFSSCP
jgi:hypothetical protein